MSAASSRFGSLCFLKGDRDLPRAFLGDDEDCPEACASFCARDELSTEPLEVDGGEEEYE